MHANTHNCGREIDQFVQVTRGSSECILVLLNAKETYSEGHKLLVSHLLVSGNMQTLEARVRWQEDGVISSVSKRRQIGH